MMWISIRVGDQLNLRRIPGSLVRWSRLAARASAHWITDCSVTLSSIFPKICVISKNILTPTVISNIAFSVKTKVKCILCIVNCIWIKALNCHEDAWKNDFYDTPSLEETKWINRNRWINDEIPCRPRSHSHVESQKSEVNLILFNQFTIPSAEPNQFSLDRLGDILKGVRKTTGNLVENLNDWMPDE